MYTIKDNIEKKIVINKSKFISKSYFVNNITEVKEILNNLKIKYSDATHICYAYIIDNTCKYSDDSEPSNTAGLPIYNVIDKNNLDHVLIVVIRYFGGIKLGVGGLTRAYSNSAIKVIKDNITELISGYKIEIKIDYNCIKDVEYILKDVNIISKSFDENIVITFEISTENLNSIKEKLEKYVISFSIIDKTNIRK